MLFFKEIKKTAISITFLIFIVAIIAMSQDVLYFSKTDSNIITQPQQGEDYGTQSKEIPEIIMPSALERLYGEFVANSYTAYPIGFYKNVKLNDGKQAKMASILSKLTGTSSSKLMGVSNQAGTKTNPTGNEISIDGNANISNEGNGDYSIKIGDKIAPPSAVTLDKNIGYEEFKNFMGEADDLIGGGSYYSDTYLVHSFGSVPLTYEEAMNQYELNKTTDHFTGAYSRLFSDYTTMTLSIMPVFLAVAMCLKDRRSKISDLIHVRRASSFRLIFTRFVAIVSLVMLPVIILAYISNISVWGFYDGMTLDYLAPLKYALGWMLPSAMVSTAVGMFFTEMTGTPIAIALQGLWWFVDINGSLAMINGGYSLFQLSPRHNTLQNTQAFIDGFDTLVANRLIFAGIALILIFATAIIYEQKRRGKLNGSRKLKKFTASLANRKSKSQA